MKKIGILTQPLGRNYGGVLQAFALKLTMETMGYQVEVIRREYEIGRLRRWAMWCFYFLRRDILQIKIDKKSVYNNIEHFCDQNLSRTTPIYNTQKLSKISQKYQAIVVGSDQVWRAEYSPRIDDFFLGFASSRSGLRRVAYAASFGVDEWQFDQAQTRKYGNLLKLFEGVSVREDSAVELCARHFAVEAQLVLDPTLLLDTIQYDDLYADLLCTEGGLKVYFLDPSHDKEMIAGRVEQLTGISKSYLNQVAPLSEYKRCEQSENYLYPSVGKWLSGFRDAQFVVTDSFHGCVFSILFNKPFVAIANQQRGLTRFTSLLKQFGLEGRLVCDLSEITPELIESNIDWASVNATRERLRVESFEFLRRSFE